VAGLRRVAPRAVRRPGRRPGASRRRRFGPARRRARHLRLRARANGRERSMRRRSAGKAARTSSRSASSRRRRPACAACAGSTSEWLGGRDRGGHAGAASLLGRGSGGIRAAPADRLMLTGAGAIDRERPARPAAQRAVDGARMVPGDLEGPAAGGQRDLLRGGERAIRQGRDVRGDRGSGGRYGATVARAMRREMGMTARFLRAALLPASMSMDDLRPRYAARRVEGSLTREPPLAQRTTPSHRLAAC
jgi:hypothetical protein